MNEKLKVARKKTCISINKKKNIIDQIFKIVVDGKFIVLADKVSLISFISKLILNFTNLNH